ncbi:MAG: hypothetical protein NC906_03145 [Candidatus Omnitrophica bacterium]|nr:hypothetical protein [Candidatus Omnitrophota bacterium]
MKNSKVASTKIVERFICQVLSRKKDFVEALEILGDIYTRSGDIESALDIDTILTKLQPLNPVHYYNLACDYALVGKHQKAIFYLNIAVTLGFSDFKHLKKDPDLAKLRTDPQYEKVIKGICTRRIK